MLQVYTRNTLETKMFMAIKLIWKHESTNASVDIHFFPCSWLVLVSIRQLFYPQKFTPILQKLYCATIILHNFVWKYHLMPTNLLNTLQFNQLFLKPIHQS